MAQRIGIACQHIQGQDRMQYLARTGRIELKPVKLPKIKAKGANAGR
jgi:hypothetical protein